MDQIVETGELNKNSPKIKRFGKKDGGAGEGGKALFKGFSSFPRPSRSSSSAVTPLFFVVISPLLRRHASLSLPVLFRTSVPLSVNKEGRKKEDLILSDCKV